MGLGKLLVEIGRPRLGELPQQLSKHGLARPSPPDDMLQYARMDAHLLHLREMLLCELVLGDPVVMHGDEVHDAAGPRRGDCPARWRRRHPRDDGQALRGEIDLPSDEEGVDQGDGNGVGDAEESDGGRCGCATCGGIHGP